MPLDDADPTFRQACRGSSHERSSLDPTARYPSARAFAESLKHGPAVTPRPCRRARPRRDDALVAAARSRARAGATTSSSLPYLKAWHSRARAIARANPGGLAEPGRIAPQRGSSTGRLPPVVPAGLADGGPEQIEADAPVTTAGVPVAAPSARMAARARREAAQARRPGRGRPGDSRATGIAVAALVPVLALAALLWEARSGDRSAGACSMPRVPRVLPAPRMSPPRRSPRRARRRNSIRRPWSRHRPR